MVLDNRPRLPHYLLIVPALILNWRGIWVSTPKKQCYQQTQIMTVPVVRHIRSPWSLRSGGHWLVASMKNGSAVGAI
jgi:hypothetical protein